MLRRRMCLFSVSVILIFWGLFFVFIPSVLLDYIIRTQMILTPNSTASESWEHVPELLPMDFYFFNWTNPQDINEEGVKPKFQQVGPYRFMMDFKRINVTWNENGTVTYRQQKFWYFNEAGTNGSLQDKITSLNTPALGAAHAARYWSYFSRKGVSLTLSSLYSKVYVTKTIDELLFTGYPDTLTQMASSLPIFAGQDLPKWDKFGWFYMRNGSIDFAGVTNMGTGKGTIFGELYSWNYRNQTAAYSSECAKIGGSTGDKFQPDSDTIDIYFPEMCRSFKLTYVGDAEYGGLTGKKYVLGDRVLDNGTKYPENRCYCAGDCIPSGVFNESSCQFGAPNFISLPHFYQADSYYNDRVEGLHPDGEKHEFYFLIERNTGIPLEVSVRMQINFWMHPVPSISLFEDVSEFFFPIFWFHQHATIPQSDLFKLKLLLNMPTIMISCGTTLILGGIVLVVALSFHNIRKKKVPQQVEEDLPLKGW